ncbi:MAG: hypothetical protein ACOCWQ_04115 [Nanoarchaeota archaeon]
MVLKKVRTWFRRRTHARKLAKLATSEYSRMKPTVQHSLKEIATTIDKESDVIADQTTSEALRLAEAALKEAEAKLEEARKKVAVDITTPKAKKKKTIRKKKTKNSRKKSAKKSSRKKKSSKKLTKKKAQKRRKSSRKKTTKRNTKR